MSTDVATLIDEIESSFNAIYQRQHQQQQQQQPQNSPPSDGTASPAQQILPNRLPLKRRLADYRSMVDQMMDETLKAAFTPGMMAVEKFRDLTPAFVVAIFEEYLVFEPGDIGPIPIGHPVTEELIWCINRQCLSPALLSVLGDSGAPFYDGCLVLGLVDYRKQAFGVCTPGLTHAQHQRINLMVGKEMSLSGSSTGILRNPNISPEMHKVLLRPTHQTLLTGIEQATSDEKESLQAESRLLLLTSGPICLDPSPVVSHVLQALHYDRNKMTQITDVYNGKAFSCSAPCPPEADGFRSSLASGGGGGQKFRLATVIEGERAAKKTADAEPYYGLDVKKDPTRFKDIPPNTPLFNWVQPNQRLWRSIRYETAASSNPTSRKQHITLHILLNVNGQYDLILRRGTQPFTAIDGETQTFRHPTKAAVDFFIERFQFSMELEGCQCVGDVSNPTVFTGPAGLAGTSRYFPMRPPNPGVQRSLGGASPPGISPFVNIIPPQHQQHQPGSHPIRPPMQ